MSETPSETARNPRAADGYVSDEARLLAKISDQLADLQATADRMENGAREFLPAARAWLGKRTTKAAMSAADMFRR